MWADVGSCFVAIAYDVRLARRGGNGPSNQVLGYMMHILKLSSDPNYNSKRFHGPLLQILPHTVGVNCDLALLVSCYECQNEIFHRKVSTLDG